MRTSEPKTASELLARLRETECITIRNATTADRLEHLRLNDFASDGPVSSEAMVEVKRVLDAEYAEFDTKRWWQTQTWAI
jgi:hypothetical protein